MGFLTAIAKRRVQALRARTTGAPYALALLVAVPSAARLSAGRFGHASSAALLMTAGLAFAQTAPPLLPASKEPLQRATPRAAPQPQQVVPGQSTQLQTRAAADTGIVFGQISRRAADLLARSEQAAATWQACIYDALRQGIPLSVAITLCEIKLWQDDKRGWGDAGIVNAVFREPPPPPNVVGKCGSGADPRLGKDNNPYSTVPDDTLKSLLKAMLAANVDVKDPFLKSVQDKQIDLMLDEVKSRQKRDDDKSGGGAHRTSPEGDCAQAVARMQEFLRECQRTGWKTGACQVFAARAKGCPDPRLAYVDPGAGYACGEAADPKLVAEAYARRCEALVRPGPDGRNPCRPQAAQLDARQLQGVKDLCNDPKAYHTGEGCVVELTAPSPAGFQRGGTVQEVIAIATSRFGGPIFVLPKPAPIPRGPQPMPGPGTGPQPKPGASTGLEPRPGAAQPLLTPPHVGTPR